jgi:RNA polymerase sigma-70 factor (ECF subfamily)
MRNEDQAEMIRIDEAVSGVEIHSIRPEDFEWMVLQHQKQIYRVLLFLLRDEDAAETLTQECFLKAFKKHRSFRGKSSLATWLLAIAINMARDHNRNRRWEFWRRLARTDRIETLPMRDSGRSPEQILIDNEAVNVVRSAAKKLSERQKTVFLLRFVEEMSLESIAEAMNLEVGTVKTHLSRAMNVIRNDCKKRNGHGRAHGPSGEKRDAKRQE